MKVKLRSFVTQKTPDSCFNCVVNCCVVDCCPQILLKFVCFCSLSVSHRFPLFLLLSFFAPKFERLGVDFQETELACCINLVATFFAQDSRAIDSFISLVIILYRNHRISYHKHDLVSFDSFCLLPQAFYRLGFVC